MVVFRLGFPYFFLLGPILEASRKNSKFKNDDTPLDEECDIRDLNKYSKSYLNHLIKSEEMLAPMLISLHNIYFYQEMMSNIRFAIENNEFKKFKDDFLSKYLD